jgi:hypothetical protein
MIDLSKYLDIYDIRARLFPALLSALPVIVAIYLYLPSVFSAANELIALFAGFGGVYLLAQLARDRGKALEPGLYIKWGGMPSVNILRYRGAVLPEVSLARTHQHLEKFSGIPAPTPDSEIADPAAADDIYKSWSDFLRSKTRDTSKFALLFKENISFGFRRNLLGLKPFTLFFTLMSALVAVVINIENKEIILSALDWAFIVLSLAYAITVGLVVNERWVKTPADEYAKRLIEALIDLG